MTFVFRKNTSNRKRNYQKKNHPREKRSKNVIFKKTYRERNETDIDTHTYFVITSKSLLGIFRDAVREKKSLRVYPTTTTCVPVRRFRRAVERTKTTNPKTRAALTESPTVTRFFYPRVFAQVRPTDRTSFDFYIYNGYGS